jgi:hypothetical protein
MYVQRAQLVVWLPPYCRSIDKNGSIFPGIVGQAWILSLIIIIIIIIVVILYELGTCTVASRTVFLPKSGVPQQRPADNNERQDQRQHQQPAVSMPIYGSLRRKCCPHLYHLFHLPLL